MAWRFHLFPYRTQKLSSNAPKVLGWKRPGRRGRRRIPRGAFTTVGVFFFCALCAKRRRGARLRGALAQGMWLRAKMHAVFYERVAARCAVFCERVAELRAVFCERAPRCAPKFCDRVSVRCAVFCREGVVARRRAARGMRRAHGKAPRKPASSVPDQTVPDQIVRKRDSGDRLVWKRSGWTGFARAWRKRNRPKNRFRTICGGAYGT